MFTMLVLVAGVSFAATESAPLAGVQLHDIRTAERGRLAQFHATGIALRHSRIVILDSTFSRIIITQKQRPDTSCGEIPLGVAANSLQDLSYCEDLDRFFAMSPRITDSACTALTFRVKPATESGITLDKLTTGTLRFELPTEMCNSSIEGFAVDPQGVNFWIGLRNRDSLETSVVWYSCEPGALKSIYHRDVVHASRREIYPIPMPGRYCLTGLAWHKDGLFLCACDERSSNRFRANALLLWRWQDRRLLSILPAFSAGNRVTGVALDPEALYLVFGNQTGEPSRIAVAPLALVAIDNALRTQRVQSNGKIK